MSSLTTNLKLVKPELQDNITPTIFADNFDKIDAALEGVSGGALSLEEIEASTNLDGKIPSAAALKEVNNRLSNIRQLDWDNAINLSVNLTTKNLFTPNKDGMIFVSATNVANVSIMDNLTQIKYFQYVGNTITYYANSVMVEKDRKVIIYIGADSISMARFIPFK